MQKTKPAVPVAHPPQEKLIDYLVEKLSLKNDAALARALKVAPPVISKVRTGRTGLGASLLLAMHETFDLPVAELRRLMATEEVPA